ncbi:hypothetical protein J437_LFUL006091, partial [Ladona fulva]
FWPYVREQLTNHERERFALCLRHVGTDVGRGRAWLRSSLNERSLERISHSLIWPAPPSLSDQFYHSWAFMRDEERAGVLPTAAAGLASIVFAISIDNNDLDRLPRIESGALSPLSGSPRLSEPVIPAPSGKRHAEKRRRKPPLHVISFEDDSPPATEGSGGGGMSSSSPSSSSSSGGTGHPSAEDWVVGGVGSNPQRVPRLSVHNDSTNSLPLGSPADDAPILTHSEDTELAAVALLATLNLTQSGTCEQPPPDSTVEAEEGIEASEMREGIVDGEIEVVLEEEVEDVMVTTNSIASLTRENELLKQQLRKYVSAVQMLRRSNEEAQGIDSENDAFHEAREYEQKLVQVAEMHGELMEFNDRLQRTLRMRENQLAKLLAHRRLHGCGDSDGEESILEGELAPVGVWIPSAFLIGGGADLHHVYQVYIRVGSDEWNIYRRYSQFHTLHRTLRRQLRDKNPSSQDDTGSGSKCEGEGSWPRFPPKKIVGNRDATFVEERRRALQAYLQRLIVYAMNHEPALKRPRGGGLPCKEDLVRAFPFFGEYFEISGVNHGSQFPSSSADPSCPRYTGL